MAASILNWFGVCEQRNCVLYAVQISQQEGAILKEDAIRIFLHSADHCSSGCWHLDFPARCAPASHATSSLLKKLGVTSNFPNENCAPCDAASRQNSLTIVKHTRWKVDKFLLWFYRPCKSMKSSKCSAVDSNIAASNYLNRTQTPVMTVFPVLRINYKSYKLVDWYKCSFMLRVVLCWLVFILLNNSTQKRITDAGV